MINHSIIKMLCMSTLLFACGSSGDSGVGVNGGNTPQSEPMKCEVDTRGDESIKRYITNRDSVLMCGGTGWFKSLFPPDLASWNNTTTGQNGTANIIDTQTRCFASIFCESSYYWEARVPLVVGENNILISNITVNVLYDKNYN